jgi:F-type H+-transporting ATPase subunit alpha
MKQKQFSPMTVSEMGAVLFAANEGYLEDVPVDKILDFEQAFLSYMRAEHGDFMSGVDESGDYNDEIVETLNQAITKFKETQTY